MSRKKLDRDFEEKFYLKINFNQEFHLKAVLNPNFM